MAVPDNIWLYRMVHWENVEHILNHGMCCREHENADPNYVNIGHKQLISDRHEHPIPLRGAGNLGEYVPFYFAGHSPMLFLIKDGLGGVEKTPQNDIVFIASKFEIIEQEGLEYCFTDMNAKLTIADFFNLKSDFDKLKWNYIKSKRWNTTTEHLHRKDYKQAEFLIRNHVPVNCIHGIAVFSKERRTYFQSLVDNLELPIKVIADTKRNLYY